MYKNSKLFKVINLPPRLLQSFNFINLKFKNVFFPEKLPVFNNHKVAEINYK